MFDGFTRLVSRLLDAPVALLSLVGEERQFLLSSVGLPEPWASASQIPLDHSLCSRTVALGAPLLVADVADVAADDEQSALAVSAYAGVPLVVDGQALGTLCAMDLRPRVWSQADAAVLEDIASLATNELLRRRAAATLVARDEQLHDLLERATEMIVSVSHEGLVLYANQATRDALECTPEQILGAQARGFVAPEYLDRWDEAARYIAAEGVVAHLELEVVSRSGRRVLVRGSGNSRFRNGQPVAVRLVFRDVTEQRRVEEEIALIDRVSWLLRSAPTTAAGLDSVLRCLCDYASLSGGEVRLCSDGGGPPSEVVARWSVPGAPLASPDAGAASRLDALALDAWRGGTALWPSGDGADDGVRFQLMALPLVADGEAQGAVLLCSEHAPADLEPRLAVLSAACAQAAAVLRRRRAEDAARESQARLQDFLDNMNDLVISAAPDGRILLVNRALRDTLGYSDAQIAQLTVTDLLHPDSREEALECFAGVLAGASVTGLETRFITADGRAVDVEGSCNCRFENGRPVATRSIFRDISARRRADEALRASEGRYRRLMETAHEGLWTLDTLGRADYVNPRAGEMLGYDPAQLIGRPLADFTQGEHRAELVAHLDSGLGRRRRGILEVCLRRRDGLACWALLATSPILGEDGRLLGSLVLGTDITERKAAEERLSRTVQMLDLANDAILMRSPEGHITYWNTGAERLYGWTQGEALGQPIDALLATVSARDDGEVQEVLRESGGWRGELLRRHKDGTPVRVDARWTLLHEGGIDGAILEINADVTERNRMQELFGAVLRAATENSIIGTDAEGRITLFNAGAERMLGYAAEEMVGRRTPNLLHDPYEVASRAAELGVEPGFEAFVANPRKGLAETREWTYRRKDGSTLPVSLTVTAMRDEFQRVTGFIGIGVDVTERRAVEGALRAARDAAEAAARAKSEFLANVSHEIRTPMNGIMGMTELVLDTQLKQEQREYLELVRSSSDALLRIIDDILDFSRIEAGRMVLEPQSFDLRDAFGDMLRTLAVRARDKQVELVYRVDAAVPMRLVGDVGRLRQILVNLVNNAIKFTSEGEVLVDVSLSGSDDSGVLLRVAVSDTGIGIPSDRHAVIFEPFVQADASTTRRFGGTGLGLSISRQLVEMMGGTIGVESEPQRGSTFVFTVSLKRDETTGADPYNAASLGRILGEARVLVVDDNATSRAVLAELLQGWGIRYEATDGGEAALAALAQAKEARDPFGLVLIDRRMPGMDGMALAREIHASRDLTGMIMIMLDSAAEPVDANERVRLGVVTTLAKPIKPSDLFDTLITQVLEAANHAKAALARPSDLEAEPATPVQPRLRVLVAEDNVVNQRLATALLTKHGHEAVVAQNGAEAVEFARSGAFDVILMDVQMPVLGGLEATEKIREMERGSGRRIPIIALTAHVLEGDAARCVEAGMDAYLPKPLRVAELNRLLDRIEVVTPRPEDDDGQQRRMGGPGSPTSEPASAPGPSEANGPPKGGAAERVNGARSHLRQTFDGDEATLAEVASLFLADTPTLISSLKAAREASDPVKVAQLAHRLKGSAGIFSADLVVRPAVRLLQAAHAGDLTSAEAEIAEILADYALLQELLAASLGAPPRGT